MSEENKELVRRYYREWNAGNLDVIDELFADERVAAGVRRGCGAYLAAFPDLHASIEELVAEGDKVVCRSNTTGTHDGEIKGSGCRRGPIGLRGADATAHRPRPDA
jgi:predicted ester cyclase